MRTRGFFAVLTLAISCLAAGCGPSGSTNGTPEPGSVRDSKLRVYAVNYPLGYFAERIGGDLVEVEFPAPRDADPAFWSPDADTVAAYQQADLILLNGAGYAKWVDRVTLAPSSLVDTSETFRDRYVQVEDAVVHTHGPGGAHSHGEIAFTTWLDPTLAIEQARAIQRAFAEARPEQETAFAERLESLERDLGELDRSLERVFERAAAEPWLASHPVYQYLARRYELNMRSVHFEPDELPDETDWSRLEQVLAEHPARWMLWEGDPIEPSASRLEDLGVTGVVFDPCGNTPAAGDFLTVMQANTQRVEGVLSEVPGRQTP